MKKIVLISLFLAFFIAASAQNVGINSTGATAHSSAMLDVSSTNMGLLIPRINIPNLSSASPVTSPEVSLLVYNTNATTGLGYYYWDGTGWRRLSTDKTAWQLTGNSGTIAATNFIGTTDAVDFVVRTANTERMRIASGGNVGVGTISPEQKLHVVGNQIISGGGDLYINGSLTSTSGSIHYGSYGRYGQTTSGYYVNPSGQSATGLWLEGTNDNESAGIFLNGNSISMWSAGDNDILKIYDEDEFNTSALPTPKFVVSGSGYVGIGTGSPSYMLDVTSTIRAQDIFAAGGQNVIVGDDSYLSDVDVANTMGVYGVQNTDRGGIRFGSSGGTVFGYNNNIGIGTATPQYRLDLANGTFGFGNANQRTETRDNAGLRGDAGAQSGFFETASPTNYPAGASSWWHLIDVRHSNTGNNYAMQLAGSFFDQKLYFRKTSDNAAQPWTEILTGDYFDTNVVTVESTSTLTIGGSWTVIPGETITLNNLAAGDRVLVWFGGNMNISGADWNLIDVGLFINGTLASVGGYVRTSIDTDYAEIEYINYSATARYNVPSAGNYTFDVRAMRLYGGNDVYIGGNSTDSREGVLTVFVIKN